MIFLFVIPPIKEVTTINYLEFFYSFSDGIGFACFLLPMFLFNQILKLKGDKE
jgi:hypothetical protein